MFAVRPETEIDNVTYRDGNPEQVSSDGHTSPMWDPSALSASRRDTILCAFARIEKEFPRLRSCDTRGMLYEELRTLIRCAEWMEKMQRRHCELKTVFPDVQEEVREAVNDHIVRVNEQQRQTDSHVTKQMESMKTLADERHGMFRGQVDAMKNVQSMLQPLIADVHKLSTQCHTTTQNSSLKGALGEKHVYDELVQHFHHMEVVQTGQIEHTGDIHVKPVCGDDTLPTTIVEVKFYQHPVPTKEVEKFERDIRQNDVSTALMIATSAIAKKPRIRFEWVEDVIVLYLSHSEPHHAPLGVLALQEIHKVCQSLRVSATVNMETSMISKDVMEQQLRSTCEEIGDVLSNTSDYNDNVRDLERLQTIAKSIRHRLEDQRQRTSELVKSICQRFHCDMHTASALTPVGKTVSPVCSPHGRRMLVDGLITKKKQGAATTRKHSIGVASLHELLDEYTIPLVESCSGVSLQDPNNPYMSIGTLDVKATKTTLHDSSGGIHIQLTSDTVPLCKALFQSIMSRLQPPDTTHSL